MGIHSNQEQTSEEQVQHCPLVQEQVKASHTQSPCGIYSSAVYSVCTLLRCLGIFHSWVVRAVYIIVLVQWLYFTVNLQELRGIGVFIIGMKIEFTLMYNI